MGAKSANVRRLSVVLAALALVVSACSIQAPTIELIGQGDGAGAGAPVVQQPGVTQPGQTGVGGTDPGGAPIGRNPGTNDGAAVPAGGENCLNKSTDTGVGAKEIVLGGTFATSGPVSNISGPILKGVQAYFNEVNAAGGIHGRRIRLKWYDDGWDAQRGKSFIKKLVEQDKVFALAVAPSSNGLDAAKSYLEQKKVPVFGTSGLIESQFTSSMQWPVGTSTKSVSRISLVHMKKDGVKSLAVIWLDLLAGRQAFEAIKHGTQKIIGVPPEKFLVNNSGYRVSISEADFGPVWARIQEDTRNFQRNNGMTVDGRPDFVVLAIDPTNAIKALQAAENLGFRPRVGWGGGPPLFLDLVWQGSDYASKTNLMAQSPYYPPIDEFANNKAVQDYAKAIRKHWGDDVDLNNPYLEGGYAGAAMTVEVLKRVGPCLTREAAIKAADGLTNYSAAGLTPPMTFRPIGQGQGHYGNTQALTIQVKDKKWVVYRDFTQDPTPGAE